MSSDSLTSIRLFGVSTCLVDQMQRFFPDEALDRVNSKIDIIRNGIATMSSSASSLYSSTPDSSISGPIKVLGINQLMQGVSEVQIQVPGEATYKFPIIFTTHSLFGHSELLYIGEIKEYILNQEKFTTRSETIQLLISGLLISNYACRILGIFIVTPVLFISTAILGIKYPKIVGWVYAFMFFHGFLLGPKQRQLIEYMSQPASSNATVEMEGADKAIRQIEECELALIKIIYTNPHEFTKEGLQNLLETRRTHIDLLETFLNYASSQVVQQDVLWKIKARLKENNW